jgi:cyclophilin family peptidyl-prolyl cis-trans isomerase
MRRLLVALLAVASTISPASAQEKKSSAATEKPAKKADSSAGGSEKSASDKTGEKAAEKTPEKVNEKTAAFRKLHQELTDTIFRLGEIQDEYRLVKETSRAALEKEFDEKKARAHKLLPQVTAAAEAAIIEDAADAELIDHLGAMARQAFQYSDYEKALRTAKLVLDKQPTTGKFRRPELYQIAGIAAFYATKQDAADNTEKFDAADTYLQELAKPEYFLASTPRAQTLRQETKQERDLWAEELKRQEAQRKPDSDPQALPRVRLTTTAGDIDIELFEDEAPNTVANFITLVDKKFYDGKTLASSSVEVTTGIPLPEDKEVDYKIACEWVHPNFRRHFRGSLSMNLARGEKDTGCSEFIICLEPNRGRDPQVIDKNNPTQGAGTVFGRVVAGLEVLSKVRQNIATRPLSQGVDKITKAARLNKLDQKYEVKKIVEEAKADDPKKTEPKGTEGKGSEGKAESKEAGGKRSDKDPEKAGAEKPGPKKGDATKAGEKSK